MLGKLAVMAASGGGAVAIDARRRWILGALTFASLISPTMASAAVNVGRFVEAPCLLAECPKATSAFFQVYSAQNFSGSTTILGLDFSLPSGEPLYLPPEFSIFAYYTSQSGDELSASKQPIPGSLIANFGTFTYKGLLRSSLQLTGSGFEYNPEVNNLLIAVVGKDSVGVQTYTRTDPQTGDLIYYNTIKQPASSVVSRARELQTTFITASPSAVPEPATWAMMLIGFGAVGCSFRKRKTWSAARTRFSKSNA
jgi:hypothetical protein